MKVLMTEATDGIGRETAHRLFAASMRVLARGRSETKARRDAAALSGGVPDGAWEHFLANNKLVKAYPGK